MKKSRAVTLVVIVVVVLLVFFYEWGPSSVPAGQRPLLSLSASNFADFVQAFDGGANSPRLLLLLSPT